MATAGGRLTQQTERALRQPTTAAAMMNGEVRAAVSRRRRADNSTWLTVELFNGARRNRLYWRQVRSQKNLDFCSGL